MTQTLNFKNKIDNKTSCEKKILNIYITQIYRNSRQQKKGKKKKDTDLSF